MFSRPNYRRAGVECKDACLRDPTPEIRLARDLLKGFCKPEPNRTDPLRSMKSSSSLKRRLSAALLLAAVLARVTSPAARADILALDWSHLSAAYQSGAANAATTQTFTVGSNTVSTVFGYQGGATSSAFILSTPAVATNGSGSPADVYTTGGLTDGELAMQIGIALPTTSANGIVFTINFAQAVYGVTFKLFDVDYTSGSFTDQIRNIVGSDGTNTFLPALAGSTYNSVGSAANNMAAGFNNSVTGTGNNAQTSANGNVTVSFSNTDAITSVSFVYGDNTNSSLGPVAPASTTEQIIGIGNVLWATNAGESVPEPGTFGVISLGLASLLTVTLRRRQ